MSSGAKTDNVTKLMMALNLKFTAVPDHLKCAKCQSVLKDACQVPCGCKFCRGCIDDVLATGRQFCLGGSQECGETSLSSALPDYGANKRIRRLTAKCPQSGCYHECPLADMEGHLRVCPKKIMDCPFRELGCVRGKLAAEEMSDHLQRDSRIHSEILIEMVANVNREIEILKRELAQKDEQMRHVENENKLIKHENKSIKGEIESIKQEKEVLCDRLRQLSEELEREVDERRQSDERDATRITANTEAIRSNRDALGTEMEPVKNNMKSINEDIQSIKLDNDCIKPQLRSALRAVGLWKVCASCDEWLIEKDLGSTNWYTDASDIFMGRARYTCQLISDNSVERAKFCVELHFLCILTDCLLEWPFIGAVTITVAHRDKRKVNCKQTRRYRLEKPLRYDYNSTDLFEFSHAELRAAGLDLERGVRVSCQITPDEIQ